MNNLISGKEAKLAWANGQEVQVKFKSITQWEDVTDTHWLSIFSSVHVDFRLKPQTITVTLELPKPFKPVVGDKYWFVYADFSEGYTYATYENNLSDKNLIQFGAYRTEEEVKQAVEALRAAALKGLQSEK